MCASLFKEWMAHLCGLCLTLRTEHGQASRLVTNYDGLLISVLVEAQSRERSPHRTAGPCALRGMRGAEVVDARAQGARLAAAVSLLLAAGKARDHVADRDGAYARRLVAATAGAVANRWDAAGARAGVELGFDPTVLRDAAWRHTLLEATSGLSLLELTEPTETAVAAAFAHTAVLAGRPANTEPLAEAGRFFGRLAHLIDAVEDLESDRAAGAYNPLLGTGTDLTEARRHCDAALHGLRLALADVRLENRRLVSALLDREVRRSVDQVFAGYPQGRVARGPTARSSPMVRTSLMVRTSRRTTRGAGRRRVRSSRNVRTSARSAWPARRSCAPAAPGSHPGARMPAGHAKTAAGAAAIVTTAVAAVTVATTVVTAADDPRCGSEPCSMTWARAASGGHYGWWHPRLLPDRLL